VSVVFSSHSLRMWTSQPPPAYLVLQKSLEALDSVDSIVLFAHEKRDLIEKRHPTRTRKCIAKQLHDGTCVALSHLLRRKRVIGNVPFSDDGGIIHSRLCVFALYYKWVLSKK